MNYKKAVFCPACSAEAKLKYFGNTSSKDFFLSLKTYNIAEGHGYDRLDVYECPKCFMGFSICEVTQKELMAFYTSQPTDKEYLKEERGRRKSFRGVLKRLEGFGYTKGKVLDFGSGPGLFLSEAKNKGWEVFGSESSEWARQYAEEKYGIILKHDTETEEFTDNFFDVITLFDVIEHLPVPIETINFLTKKLKPGGMLVLTTPRFDSFVRKIMGVGWHFMFPAHLLYFSKDSISAILQKSGYEKIYFKLHTFHFSLRYILKRIAGVFHVNIGESNNMLGNVEFPINLRDEFEIYAKKISKIQL